VKKTYNPACKDCKQKKVDVKKVYCPFLKELYGEKVRVLLCDDCYTERVRGV